MAACERAGLEVEGIAQSEGASFSSGEGVQEVLRALRPHVAEKRAFERGDHLAEEGPWEP